MRPGLRWGEFVALRPVDVDFDTRYLATLPGAGDRALAAYRKTRYGTLGDYQPPSA